MNSPSATSVSQYVVCRAGLWSAFILCMERGVKVIKSKFYEDKRKEELFGNWLDNHFYIKMLGKYKSITRNSDATLQKRGVDVIIETNGGKTIYI